MDMTINCMLKVSDTGCKWSARYSLVVINDFHTITVRAEGVQFGCFVFKSKLKFVITTKNVFLKVVRIYNNVMRRTIDRSNVVNRVFVTWNGSKINHWNIFSTIWFQGKAEADISVPTGYDCVIIWNPGMLTGPNSRCNRICSGLIPKSFRCLYTN